MAERDELRRCRRGREAKDGRLQSRSWFDRRQGCGDPGSKDCGKDQPGRAGPGKSACPIFADLRPAERAQVDPFRLFRRLGRHLRCLEL